MSKEKMNDGDNKNANIVLMVLDRDAQGSKNEERDESKLSISGKLRQGFNRGQSTARDEMNVKESNLFKAYKEYFKILLNFSPVFSTEMMKSQEERFKPVLEKLKKQQQELFTVIDEQNKAVEVNDSHKGKFVIRENGLIVLKTQKPNTTYTVAKIAAGLRKYRIYALTKMMESIMKSGIRTKTELDNDIKKKNLNKEEYEKVMNDNLFTDYGEVTFKDGDVLKVHASPNLQNIIVYS